MNSSQVFKRTIPVLIVILLVVGAAVLASVLSRDKIVPSITDEDGVFLTIEDQGRTYNLSKKYMYDELKSNVGLRVLLDNLDRQLLKNQKKDDSNYLDIITEEEILKAIKEEAFGNKNEEDLTPEEQQELLDEYYDTLYVSSGLTDEAEVQAYHRLRLAKELYAKDRLKEEIELADKLAKDDDSLDPYFTESEYETKYKANFLNSYWAIIIPFQSQTEAKLALEQVGLKVDEDSKSGNYANLVKITDDEEEVTTPTDIAKAFIEMYNTFYSRFLTDYPNTTKTLVEGVHYSFNEEGELVFHSTVETEEENLEKNRLYLTNEDVANINKQAENFLKGMLSYTSNSAQNKWYTAEPRVYDNKLYVYMLKIKVVDAPSLDSVRDEVFELLFEDEITDAYITKKMIELRELNLLEILDESLEKEYARYTEGYELSFKTTKAEDEKVIARVRDFEITADQLFADMYKYYGSSIVASEVNYLRFLNSPSLNKVYDYYTPNLKVSERILDKEKWEEVRTAAVNEKNIFLAGGYQQFPPTYGWKNFMRDYYGVESVEELMFTLLYTKLRGEYASSLLEIENLTEDSEQWKDIVAMMQKEADKYFSVNGLQVMISVKDEDGRILPKEEWTETQVQYAEELYGKIWKYIETEAGDYDTKLNALVTKFKDAPRFLASLPQETSAQPALEGNPYVLEEEGLYSIELSKYKTAGLSIDYERVSSLTNTSTPTETIPEKLKEIAKEIFDLYPNGSTEEVRYGYTFGSDEYEYLISENGYHVYINTSTVEAPKWNYTGEEEKHVLPTLQMIKTIAKDNAANKLLDSEGNVTSIDFTSAMKTAVTKHFDPVKNEITGSTNVLIQLYEQMQSISLEFKVQDYSNEKFNAFLDKVIEIYKENLTYIDVEE